MARSIDYTVAYSDHRGTVDLCKILFAGDGSYYVTAQLPIVFSQPTRRTRLSGFRAGLKES